MTHLLLSLIDLDLDKVGNFGLWAFLTISAVALFAVFIPLVTFIDSRRKEREAYYKAETIRRVAEASGEGARAAVELLRHQDRIAQIKVREGLKMGGIINIGVGSALVIFLGGFLSWKIALCGLIPGFIGLAMLVYVFLLASPVD